MKIRNPIEQMTIAPRRSTWVQTLAICTIASLPWIWFLHGESDRYERLLADKQIRTMQVERLVVYYANGARSTVEIKESR